VIHTPLSFALHVHTHTCPSLVCSLKVCAQMEEFVAIDNDISILDDGIDDIDRRVAKLQAQRIQLASDRRQLYTRRNALTALCRLPYDVIYRVLQCLRTLPHPSWQDLSTQNPERFRAPRHSGRNEWTRIMLVCTHLRAAALSSPNLWSRVDVDDGSREWAWLCVERAKSSLLDLHILDDESAYTTYAEFRRAIALVPQAGSLNMLRSYDAWQNGLHNTLRYKTPFLRTLVCTSTPDMTLAIKLTPSLMGALSATLTKLVMEHIIIDADGARFPSLVHLDLYDCMSKKSSDILELVAGSPRLEQLYLNKIRSVRNTGVGVVSLPRLAFLGFSSGLEVVIYFIPFLPIPERGYFIIEPSSDPASSELHLRAFQCATSAFGLPRIEDSSIPFIGLHNKKIEGINHICLRLERRGIIGGTPSMTYEDHSRTIEVFDTILDCAKALYVHNDIFAPAFFHSGYTRAGDALHALEHLVIEDFHNHLYHFKDWILERLKTGKPLKTIDFQGLERYVKDYVTLRALARAMVEAGVAEQVLVNGQSEGAAALESKPM
jgi:hypothetical protein